MQPRAAAVALAAWSHLAYTSLFERTRIVAGGSATPVPYATLTGVLGAGSPSTFSLPNATTAATPPGAGLKFAHHVGFVNMDGAQTITITAPDGKLINGSASLVLPASPGAFAVCFFDTSSSGSWVAITAAGAGALFVPPPSYTVVGPAAPQTFTNAGFTAVNNASITTAPFSASQKAIIMYTVQLQLASLGARAQADYGIFDGAASVRIDTWQQAIDPVSELQDPFTNTVVTEVPGNGSARTFGLAIAADDSNSITVPINRCRGVVQIVDG